MDPTVDHIRSQDVETTPRPSSAQPTLRTTRGPESVEPDMYHDARRAAAVERAIGGAAAEMTERTAEALARYQIGQPAQGVSSAEIASRGSGEVDRTVAQLTHAGEVDPWEARQIAERAKADAAHRARGVGAKNRERTESDEAGAALGSERERPDRSEKGEKGKQQPTNLPSGTFVYIPEQLGVGDPKSAAPAPSLQQGATAPALAPLATLQELPARGATPTLASKPDVVSPRAENPLAIEGFPRLAPYSARSFVDPTAGNVTILGASRRPIEDGTLKVAA